MDEWVGRGVCSNDGLQTESAWVRCGFWSFLELNFVLTVYFIHLHFSTAIEYIFCWSALNKVNLGKLKLVITLLRLYSY